MNNKNFQFRIVFHNLKGYDGHFIVRLALRCFQAAPDEQFFIGSSREQFSYIRYGKFIFMDSAQHLKASLDELVKITPPEEFRNFRKLKLPEILLRKGVYPYEYIDNFDKLNEPRLPAKECFNNSLKNEEISEADYQHAQNFWKTLNCQSFLDYHKAYLLSDTVLLANVVENYRNFSPKENILYDPLCFSSALSFTMNKFLTIQGEKTIYHFAKKDEKILKLIVNIMRGGICSRGELT
jgi:hypothetical protein